MPAPKHNAFVSYAWVDNQPQEEGGTGWVSTFVNRLRKHLNRELPRALAGRSVWLDYEKLRGSENISAKIREKLEASQLLVPVVSKGYLESPWCRQELEIFVEEHGPDSGRIFPVWMSPTDELPRPLDSLLKYKFWYEDEASRYRTRWFPDIDATDREYGLIQQDMARDMAARLLQEPPDEQADRADLSHPESGCRRTGTMSDNALVLVNGGDEDAELIREVACLLHKNHGISVTTPLSVLKNRRRLKSSHITRDLREKLKLCSAVLVVYKDGPEHQIHGQLTEYVKAASRRPKSRPPPTLDLCRPDGGPLELGFLLAPMTEHVCRADCTAECVQRFVDGLP